jgi:hypothetical protein
MGDLRPTCRSLIAAARRIRGGVQGQADSGRLGGPKDHQSGDQARDRDQGELHVPNGKPWSPVRSLNDSCPGPIRLDLEDQGAISQRHLPAVVTDLVDEEVIRVGGVAVDHEVGLSAIGHRKGGEAY